MPALTLQLDSRPEVNRDLSVELVQAVTGRKVTVKPFLDGTVNAGNLEAGDWRIAVKHPNVLFTLADRVIRVFRDRPTFVPVKIPKDLLENASISDTPEADLAPTRARLIEAVETAGRQAKKLAGQPIYADDWNELAETVAAGARATIEATNLLSPAGHDHPELVAKLDEIQRNLQRISDVFGQAIAQLQRAQQIDALRDRTDAAVDRLNAALAVDAATRQQINRIFDALGQAAEESPATFATRLAASAAELDDIIEDLAARRPPDVRETPELQKAKSGLGELIAQNRAKTHTEELLNTQRFYKAASINLAAKAR